MKRRFAAGAAALLAAAPVRSELWSLDSSLNTRAEFDDNATLVAVSPLTARRLLMQGSLAAARESETAATKLDAGLNLRVADNVIGRDAEGRLALAQTLAGATDTLAGGLDFTRDNPLEDRRNAADVLLGRTTRTSASGSASWSHALDERWSATAQGSLSHTGYSGTAASGDYRNRSFGGSLRQRWDEITSLSLNLSRSDYGLASGATRTLSDSLHLGASRSLDENSSLSLGWGGYRTQTIQNSAVPACPLQVPLCAAGLVAWVSVPLQMSQRSSGTQYDAAWDTRADERSTLHAGASRTLAPSGAGVVRNDAMELSLGREFSPTWRAALAWQLSRTQSPTAAGGPQPRLSTLDASMTWNLGESIALVAGLVRRELDESTTGLRARSNAISITLQYRAPKIVAAR